LELPEDLRLKWVNSIINRYCVGKMGVSRIIFGEKSFLDGKVPTEYVNKGPHGAGAAKGNKKLAADFLAFKNGQNSAAAQREPEAAELQAQEPETQAGGKQGGNTLTIRDECVKLAQQHAEKIDVTRIAELLRALSGTGAKLTIEVVL
jgi:hypothetical protein